MPRGDRTGPSGQGPMTGRAAGYCAGFSTPGFANPGVRSPWSRIGASGGRGRGMMRRNWYYTTGQPGWTRYDTGFPSLGIEGMPYPMEAEPGEEKEMLREQADFLKQQLDDIQKRLSEMEKEKKAK